jgi:hypothetical protein
MLNSIEVDLIQARPGRKELLQGVLARFRLERTGDCVSAIIPGAPSELEDQRLVLSVEDLRKLALFFSMWVAEICDNYDEEDDEEDEEDEEDEDKGVN